MLIFPTYQTLLTKPVATGGDGDGDGGSGGDSFITTDLKVHYDFSNTSCWSRNNSSNAADYTVHNLIDDYNDAFFRVRTNNSFQYGSDSDVIDYDSDGGGCWVMDPTEYWYQDAAVLVIPGTFSGTNALQNTHNLPTETSSHNLFNGVGEGEWTFETWTRFYVNSSNARVTYPWSISTTNTGGNTIGFNCIIYGLNFPFWFLRNKVRHFIHTTQTMINLPTAVSSGAAWTDWLHIVLTRDDSNTFKLYFQNSNVYTLTQTHNLANLRFLMLNQVGDANQMPTRTGIFRFYKGKHFSSTDVTTNWNAQKSRFGH